MDNTSQLEDWLLNLVLTGGAPSADMPAGGMNPLLLELLKRRRLPPAYPPMPPAQPQPQPAPAGMLPTDVDLLPPMSDAERQALQDAYRNSTTWNDGPYLRDWRMTGPAYAGKVYNDTTPSPRVVSGQNYPRAYPTMDAGMLTAPRPGYDRLGNPGVTQDSTMAVNGIRKLRTTY